MSRGILWSAISMTDRKETDMSRKQQEYEDDDGRTLADMSSLGRFPMLGSLFIRIPPDEHRMNKQKTNTDADAAPQEPLDLTRKEKRYAIFGAMGAGLLIGCIFIVGLLAVILLMLVMWGAFR